MEVHIHIRHPVVLEEVVEGSVVHSPARSHRSVLVRVTVRVDSLVENILGEGGLDDRRDRPFLVVHTDVVESVIDSPNLELAVLPESAGRAMSKQ